MDTQIEDLTEEVNTQIEMSESAGGGEGGSVVGAGQDAEADSEPPQQAPPLPEDYNLEDETPPAAKRPKMSEDEQELEQVGEPIKIQGETPEHDGVLQDEPASPSQSRVPVFIRLHVIVQIYSEVYFS